jgi:hypothetical protein
MLHCDYCSASIFGVCAMNDVVEDILNTYYRCAPSMLNELRIQGKELADTLKTSRLLASAMTSS